MSATNRSGQMCRVYEFRTPPSYAEALVEQFIKKLTDQKRLSLIERGRTSTRIEETLEPFFHFLAQKGIRCPENGKEAEKYKPALSVHNWLWPTKQALMNEWRRMPPPGVKMIARRAIAFLEEKGFDFKHAPQRTDSCEAEVIPLFKRPR